MRGCRGCILWGDVLAEELSSVERSYFCQQSPVSSTGSSGAPTSSPLLLDVESDVCTAQHSARDKPSGRKWGNTME